MEPSPAAPLSAGHRRFARWLIATYGASERRCGAAHEGIERFVADLNGTIPHGAPLRFPTSVYLWLPDSVRRKRPSENYRIGIEALSGGEVPSQAWFEVEESSEREPNDDNDGDLPSPDEAPAAVA